MAVTNLSSSVANSKVAAILLAGSLTSSLCFAGGNDLAPDQARVKLSVGAFVISRVDTTVALSERNVGVGVSVNPQDSIGTDLKQSVFRLDGSYRFNQAHGIEASWYRVSNRGQKTTEADFDWIDDQGNEITIDAGSDLSSELSYEIAKVNYNWTFYHNDKVELYTSAGLHMTRFAVEIEINSVINGNAVDTSARDVKSTIPLPAFGLGLHYNITRQWHWYMETELFALDFDDWRGTYTDAEFGVEYTPFKHFGISLGVASSNLNVIEQTNEYRFSYDNRITGLNLQLSTMF